jgi:transcriptional regulator with XRE-family HTH domain
MKYPNRIRLLRERQDMSQVELARLVGTTQQQVSRYEKGEHELTVDWMRRFSKALGVPPMELISNAAMAGLIDDVEPLSGGEYSAVVAITAAKGTHLYRVLTDSVARRGIPLGAIIGVDRTATPKTGDIVLVEMSTADESDRHTYCMLWQYAQPDLLHTNRAGFNIIVNLDDPMLHIRMVGVVIQGGGDHVGAQ